MCGEFLTPFFTTSNYFGAFQVNRPQSATSCGWNESHLVVVTHHRSVRFRVKILLSNCHRLWFGVSHCLKRYFQMLIEKSIIDTILLAIWMHLLTDLIACRCDNFVDILLSAIISIDFIVKHNDYDRSLNDGSTDVAACELEHSNDNGRNVYEKLSIESSFCMGIALADASNSMSVSPHWFST